MNIFPLRAFKDNYIWVIVNEENNKAIVVDPGDANPILEYFQHSNLTLSAILITHKHWDHVNGVSHILKKFSLPVYGPISDALPFIDYQLKENDSINIKGFMQNIFQVISIPGHTMEHIAYYGQGCLFSGDTLFTGGCGRVFEGTAAQMLNSLNKLASLPDDTLIYCGHEYTLQNLKFAQLIDSKNADIHERIKQSEKLISMNIPAVPSALLDEKKTNPFLRCHLPEIISNIQEYAGAKLDTIEEVFKVMREWKNNFTG